MVWQPVLVSLVPYANVVVSEQLRKGPERQNLANVYFFALLASRQMGVQPHLPFLLSSAPLLTIAGNILFERRPLPLQKLPERVVRLLEVSLH
ncbi:hypothetical protein CNN82_09465 [Pseudomonas frederiksbergensis]|uniref:Uncharacterized protein n=1 Tax=Pseudomonas frederiksbergensis TaxID=104087 RepID=A0AB33E893_9PSED|nr:hypothetical protein CNN82_09465 [Pseudomonas frederiksbergensis]